MGHEISILTMNEEGLKSKVSLALQISTYGFISVIRYVGPVVKLCIGPVVQYIRNAYLPYIFYLVKIGLKKVIHFRWGVGWFNSRHCILVVQYR